MLDYGFLVFLLIQCLFMSVRTEIKGDLFSSREALIELYKSENIAMGLLRTYMAENHVEHDYLEKTLFEFETAQWKALNKPVEYLSNPVNAFMLIKRLAVDWPIVLEVTDELNGAVKREEEFSVPTESDLLSAVLSIERLQNTYNLNASDLKVLNVNGVIYDGIHMKPMDCYEIGRQLYGSGKFGRAVEWFEETLEEITEVNYFINTLYYLAYSYYKTGYKQESAERFKVLSEIIALNTNKTEEIEKYRTQIKEMRVHQSVYDPKEDEWNPDVKYYRKLCRGEELRTPRQTKDLTCRYVFDNSPFLRIAPLKMEVLNEVPLVAQYYDVIFDSEIAVLKELAMPNLTASAVYNDGAYERLSSRISKIQWLLDDSSPVIKRLSQRVEDMTALSAEYSEPLQIASYGLGGHYVPHYDWFGYRREVPERDRIATLMFYMSDVEQGGGTAFTRAHVLVRPVKGSAAMWYNLYRDGEGDETTFHGACPVLVGQKWAANKWLHEYGNEFERKCDLKQDSLT